MMIGDHLRIINIFHNDVVAIASVVPNKAILRGTVGEFCLTTSSPLNIKPEQIIYKLVNFVEKVQK